MDSSDEIYGSLLFFRKDGQQGTVYPLCTGQITIGSSKDADVRLKINDHRLAEIHCIIDVNDNGIATLLNKSLLAPVQVNSVALKQFRVLNNEDEIELVGKKFVYLNENISKKDVERHEKFLNQAISTPSKKKQSVTSLMKTAKKTPSLRTKTPTQRRSSTRKSFDSSSAEFPVSVTPAKKLDRSTKEKSKTTSKVIVSKALGSPTNLKKRRLSLDTNPKSPANSSRVSARNILLSKNVVSSTITEEDEFVSPKPSVSMKTFDAQLKANEFLDESNVSLQTVEDSSQVESTPANRKISLRTPSKPSINIVVTEATRVKLATSKIDTPVNKRVASIKGTPLSLDKISPLYKSSPRVSRSAKRLLKMFDTVIKLNESADKTGTPTKNTNLTLKMENESAFLSKKDTRKTLEQTDDYEENLSAKSGKRLSNRSSALSIKKEETPINLNSFDEAETFTKQEVVSSKSELSHSITRKSRLSSARRNQFEENLIDLCSPKTINLQSRPSLGRKRKISSIESDDLSSEESVALNLSSNSSVSPIKSFSSPSGDENVAPSLRKSLLRKSLRRSKQVQSSNADSVRLALTDGDTPSTSGRRQSQKPKPLRKSTGKLSLRKSDIRVNVEKEQEIDQLLDDDSSDSNSPDKFVTKSRPLKNSSISQKEEQFEMPSSSEESLHLRLSESKSPDQFAERPRKSRQSLRKSNVEEAEDKQTVQKEVGKQHMEERFLVLGSTNKFRQSLRRSATMEMEEQTNMLSSSEESIHLSLTDSESPKHFSEKSKRSSRIRDSAPDEAITKPRQSSRKSDTGKAEEKQTMEICPVQTPKEKGKQHLDEGRFLASGTPNQLTRSSRNKTTEMEKQTDALSSSEESRHLNLSESPKQSLMVSDAGDAQEKPLSAVKLRQSQPKEQPTTTSRQSLRKSQINSEKEDVEPLNKEQPTTTSRQSLRKSQINSEKEDVEALNKSTRRARQSKAAENESLQKALLLAFETLQSKSRGSTSGESEFEEEPNAHQSANKSCMMSRPLIRRSNAVEKEEKRESSEELLVTPEIQSPSKSFMKSWQPLRRTLENGEEVENVEGPNEESFKTQTSAKLVGKFRQSTRSKVAVKEEILSGTALPEELLNEDVADEFLSEKLLIGPFKVDQTPKERRSIRKSCTASRETKETPTVKDQPGTSVTKSSSVSRQGFDEVKTPIDRRRRLTRKNNEINAESPLLYVTSAEQRKLNELQYSSEEESLILMETASDRYTPKVRHSSVRKSHIMNGADSEEEVDTEASLNKTASSRRSLMNKSTPINKLSNPLLNISKQNISVITLNDSVDGTPENNTSVIIIDTPFEATRKSSRKRPSKTLNSTLHDDSELTTPKSAITGRRSVSLPYNPLTEDITPVTPLADSKNDNDFKTPVNTPGVFENIKKSVLKSRSRLQRSGTSLMDELNKVESTTKAVKRARESSMGSARLHKKRKVEEGEANNSFESDNGDINASFASFKTEDILSDVSDDQIVSHNTPKYFSNLTDKPVIIDPQSKSLPEPKKKKPIPLRRSLHAMRLETQTSSETNNLVKSDSNISSLEVSSEISDSLFEDSLFSTSSITSRRSSRRSSLTTETVQGNDFSKRQQKSQKNDLSEVAGLKRLRKTPKDIKSPKNDLTDVKGVKKLFQTPKTITSPKNDLTNIVGVKKLFSTPKIANTPKNDLRNVPNLKKWVSPKQQDSPKNDLSDVAGLKKLLSTPKNVKSPKNDLRNVPNLKKWVSPKQQSSPKNDLSDVAGLKKLLSTPKEVKSPKNDLTKVPNLRRLMSPKPQNSPRNDLSDVAGMKKLFSTPKKQNSPKNDLTNVPNLRRIMSPKQQNSPKNDLSEVHGLKKLMKTPRKIKEPTNDLTNVEGVASIFNISGVQRLSNESDIENNEDLFDKLFAKKPLRTYRGKSASPDSRKAMVFNDHRKTVGDEQFTSPRVEKWVKEQAVITLQEAGGPDEDNDVFEDNEITNKMKGRNLVEEDNVQSPKVASRGRRKVVEKEDHEEVTLKRTLRGRKKTEEKDEVVVDNEYRVEPPKITARGKRKLADAVVETPRETEKAIVVSEPVVDLTKENDTELIAHEEIEFKNRQKIVRGRRKVNREYGKHTTLDEAVTETVTVDDLKENNEADQAEAVDKPEGTNVADFKLPPAKRGRSKKTTRKEDSDDQIAEVHSTTEEIDFPVPIRGEGRRVIRSEGDTSSDSKIPTAVRIRGRTRNVLGEESNSTEDTGVKRGRHLKELKEENVSSAKRATNDVTEVTPIKKAVRSRRIAGKADLDVNADEKVDLKKTSGKNKNEAEEETPKATEVIRKTRGRRAAQQSQREVGSPLGLPTSFKRGSSESDTAIAAEEEQPKAEVAKKLRGKRAAQQKNEKSATPEVTRRGRGRKKVAEEEKEDAVSKEVEPVKTTRGTRRGVILDTDEGKEITNKSTGAIKRTGRSRKKSSKEVKDDEDKKMKSIKNTATRGRLASKESEESEQKKEAAPKLTNKRTRTKVLEVNSPVVDSPRTRDKKGNFKKYGSEFVTDMGDNKSKLKTTDKEREEERNKSPEVTKSTGRSKKKLEEVKDNEDKETEPAKTTRSRRRPAVKKTEESEEKEEVAVKATNKRTRAKVLEEELPVIDSPRTRVRKGNFKKYGSDFVTEMGDTKSESKSKKVHFEESDTEKASQRPKRTRK